MKRIRKLGLVALAALALTAVVGVAPATAGFSADKYPSTVEAEMNSPIALTLGAFGEISCWEENSTSELKGHVREISVVPGLLSCSGSPSLGKVAIKTNGCQFTFRPGAFGADGTFGIAPAGCGPVVVSSGSLGCEWKIAPQAVSTNEPFTNAGSPSAVEVPIASALPYTSEKSGTCTSAGSFNFKANWSLKAFFAGAQVGLYADDKDGFYFNGGTGLFEAEAYPVAVGGPQDPSKKHLLKLGTLPAVSCTTAGLSGNLPAAASQLQLDASYGGCTIMLLGSAKAVTIQMNSCDYTLNGAGTAGVACSKEGDTIKIITYNKESILCEHRIAAQSGLKATKYATVGEGSNRGVSVGFELSGIALTRAQGSALTCGPASTTAAYSGGSTLYTQ